MAAIAAAVVLAGCGRPGSDPVGQPVTSAPSAQAPSPAGSPAVEPTTPPAVGPTDAPPQDPADVRLTLEPRADGFEAPVLALARPGSDELWVVEQAGRIHAVAADGGTRLVADLRDRVAFGGERGLLGLAFPPDHPATGGFVLHHSRRGDGATRIEAWRVAGDGTAASERVLLDVQQPAGNHNGGMVAFDADGLLYVGLGDGGGADDRFGQGQRPDTLLGTILRIDPRAGDPYGVPPTNPFVDGRTPDGGPAAPEVWAYGLRNPWRFWIDDPSGQLVVADVGQNRIEEVDALPLDAGGANLGWPIREGSRCFREDPCRSDGLVAPIAEYDHDEGCSITGGIVVRGGPLAALDGHFLYSDFCSGLLRSVVVDGPRRAEVFDWTEQVGGALGRVTSFGIDVDGAPLVLTADGRVQRLVPA